MEATHNPTGKKKKKEYSFNQEKKSKKSPYLLHENMETPTNQDSTAPSSYMHIIDSNFLKIFI